MAMYLADDINEISFGVQASNVSEVAQFSSTLDNVVMRMYTNNGSATDNLTTGVAIGSSNYDKTATASNNLYIGHITGKSNINPVLLMQDSKIAINTVPFSNCSLTVSGITTTDVLVTPLLLASNINDMFANIGSRSYINSASVTIGTISPSGVVPFTVTFNGNSTSYTYTLTYTSNGVTTSLPQRTSTSITDTFTASIATGTYTVNILINTPGSGTGSIFNLANIASFTVPVTDDIGTPVVSLASAPTFSTNYTYVSGVPYYASGTSVTFGTGKLSLSNIYKVIDPRTAITNVLTVNGSNFTYSQVFNNVLSSSTQNDKSLAVSLLGPSSTSINMSATVRNINNQAGNNYVIMNDIAYLGTPIDESSASVCSYTNMTISGNIVRMSIPATEGTPLAPNIDNLTTFSGTSPTIYDSFYAPYDAKYFPLASSITRGTYAPTLPSFGATARPYFLMKITTTAAMPSFVLYLTNSSGIDAIRVQWAALGTWYNALTLFNAGGCAASSYLPGATRFPITLPQGLSLTQSSDIYINVQFSGYLAASGISVAYT